MKFTLSLKPLSLNHCYRGRRFDTPEKKRYDRALQLLIPRVRSKIKGPYYRVIFRFFLKRWLAGDLDNLCKVLLDNIVDAGIISNDRRVVEIMLQKFPAKTDRIEVEVEGVEEFHSEAFEEED